MTLRLKRVSHSKQRDNSDGGVYIIIKLDGDAIGAIDAWMLSGDIALADSADPSPRPLKTPEHSGTHLRPLHHRRKLEYQTTGFSELKGTFSVGSDGTTYLPHLRKLNSR